MLNIMSRVNPRLAGSVAVFMAAAVFVAVLPACAKAAGTGSAKTSILGPIPSVHAPLAPYDLLLDVTRAGDDYVAVGLRGVIVRSSDGLHWHQQQAPVQSALTAVDFINGQYGWAVGHSATILATRDGGKTWHIQMWAPKMQTEFLDVFFSTSKRASRLVRTGCSTRPTTAARPGRNTSRE